MITDPRALNMLKQRQKFCRYCKRPINNTSPMYLDCKKWGDDFIYWHTKCLQSKGDYVYHKVSHKSTRSQEVARYKPLSGRRHG